MLGGAIELTATGVKGSYPDDSFLAYPGSSCPGALQTWAKQPVSEPVLRLSNSFPFVGCMFNANVATQHGGAVMLGAVRLGIGFEDCVFQYNRAREYGGALYAQTSTGNTLVKNGTFFNKYVALATRRR